MKSAAVKKDKMLGRGSCDGWRGWGALEKIYRWLLVAMPAVLYFSYFPVISLGGNETMNYELSLPLIWLVMYDVVTMGLLVREKFWREWRRGWVWLLFPVWATLSVGWSLNAGRGVLTAGVMWLVVLAAYGMVRLRRLMDARWRGRLLRAFFGAGLVACGWCVVQCVLDLAGASRDVSLMCAGCVSEMFGFPHPNGWAIEPQFMGNLLLAPTLVAVYEFATLDRTFLDALASAHRYGGRFAQLRPRWGSMVSKSAVQASGKYVRRQRWRFLILFGVFAGGIFLTFSRGAIYAMVIGMGVMSIYYIIRKKGRRVLAVWGVMILSFLFTLNLQGVMAAVGPTDDTYFTGITKVLNHLSLGTVDVHATAAVFDGYVAESTETRLRLTGAAVEVWRSSFPNAVVGVGLGGAGQALYDAGLTPAPKEIVQNEYASLLLETGVIGVSLFALLIVMAVRWVMVRRRSAALLVLSLMLAYGVTLLFFSGLPNALQVYLMPAMMVVIGFSSEKVQQRA